TVAQIAIEDAMVGAHLRVEIDASDLDEACWEDLRHVVLEAGPTESRCALRHRAQWSRVRQALPPSRRNGIEDTAIGPAAQDHRRAVSPGESGHIVQPHRFYELRRRAQCDRYRAHGDGGVRHSFRNPHAMSWSTADATTLRENQDGAPPARTAA